VLAGIGPRWLSRNHVDYYYGVCEIEATPSRPAYSGKATYVRLFDNAKRFQLCPGQSVLSPKNVRHGAKTFCCIAMPSDSYDFAGLGHS
jgi:hypothetical protein